MIVRLKVEVEKAPSPPVTVTLKFDVPEDVGDPLIRPTLLKVNPAGKLPEASVKL